MLYGVKMYIADQLCKIRIIFNFVSMESASEKTALSII